MKATSTIDTFQFRLSALLALLGKVNLLIQPGEMHALFSLIKTALGRGCVHIELDTREQTVVHVSVDNKKLLQPITSLEHLVKSMEKIQFEASEILGAAEENIYTFTKLNEAKKILDKQGEMGDMDAREKCNELKKFSDSPAPLLFNSIKKVSFHTNGEEFPALKCLRFLHEGQLVTVHIDERTWRECKKLITAHIEGHVPALDLHVTAFRTQLGKLDKVILVKLEQSK